MVCYYAWNKSDTILQKSSSGGVFYELASSALESDGVVIGAIFEKNGTVSLKSVETKKELEALLGSKYVQAGTQKIYELVKEKLSKGHQVLFSGAPCQCNALLRYLNGKHPDNLLVVDFICHGVPSEGVWKEYLDFLGADTDESDISFRDKSNGWGNFGLRVKLKDGSEYLSNHEEDAYFKLFLRDCILRPSCYSCRFKGNNRASDITLGDFWGGVGGKAVNPDGSTVVLTNTIQGKKAFDRIVPQVTAKEITIDIALNNNKNYYQSCTLPLKRKKVFEAFEKRPSDIFEKVDYYTSTTIVNRALRKFQFRLMHILCNKKPHKGYLDSDDTDVFSVKQMCCGCGACAVGCPTGAITMKYDNEGFVYPHIDSEKCCNCGKCRKLCINNPVS